MTLENHVVSLELAKELKENGYPQDDSLFYWWFNGKEWFVAIKTDSWSQLHNMPSPLKLDRMLPKGTAFPAPSNTELLKKLPVFTRGEKTGNDWYQCSHGQIHFSNENEANARAKMWLYLKKEGLL